MVMMPNEGPQLLELCQTYPARWRMEKAQSAQGLQIKICCSSQRTRLQYDRSYVAEQTRSLPLSSNWGTELYALLCDITQSSSG